MLSRFSVNKEAASQPRHWQEKENTYGSGIKIKSRSLLSGLTWVGKTHEELEFAKRFITIDALTPVTRR